MDSYVATLRRPLSLTRAIAKHQVESVRLKPGRYHLTRVPNPFWAESAEWFVLTDTDIGMASGMWMDSDFQAFQDFSVEVVENNFAR